MPIFSGFDYQRSTIFCWSNRKYYTDTRHWCINTRKGWFSTRRIKNRPDRSLVDEKKNNCYSFYSRPYLYVFFLKRFHVNSNHEYSQYSIERKYLIQTCHTPTIIVVFDWITTWEINRLHAYQTAILLCSKPLDSMNYPFLVEQDHSVETNELKLTRDHSLVSSRLLLN